MRSLLLFAISFLCFSPLCLAQVVWPGDVNNNGIVNEIDLLYLGFAFNEKGLPRPVENSEWKAQNITEEWEGAFPDGLNFAYADCNGDGSVDEADAAIIEAYLDSVHTDVPFIMDEILIPTLGSVTKFFLSSTNLEANPGETIEIPISLDNPDFVVDNILGVVFTISVNPRFFKTELTEYKRTLSSWIEFQGGIINRVFSNEEAGELTVVYTKTDKKGITGTGGLGTVSFVIEDNIINFLEKEDTVKVSVDSITVITDNLEKVPVGGTSVELDIVGRITSTYNPILDKIKFYPNPTNGWLLLKSKEVAIEKVELVNLLGQIVYQKQLSNSTFQSLDLQAVPEGMYWLRMITELGTKSTPIQRL